MNPSKSKCSSFPGGGKNARMHDTAQAGRGMRFRRPTYPQHHRTRWRYAICRYFASGGPSKALAPYWRLYPIHRACKFHGDRHTAWKPGCSTMQAGISPVTSSASAIFCMISGSSLQHLHSTVVSIGWQLPHVHLK